MKNLLVFLCFVMATVCVGQSVDYNKIILPVSTKDVSIEEKLVQIAWRNYPSTAMVVNNSEIAKYQLKKAQWSWLNHVGISGNLNEFTIKGRDEENPQNRNNFYPRYNINMSFRLGAFVETPLEVKMAREALDNSEELINQMKLQIRADVLKKYSDYKSTMEIYQIQLDSYNDAKSYLDVITKKFDKGEESVERYTNAKNTLENQEIRKINAENAYLKSKYDLEEILGLKIEEIL